MIYFRLMENIPGRTPLGYGPGAGRWNERGTPLIYCSNLRTLTMHELHSIKGSVVSTSQWLMVKVDIDYTIPQISLSDLPSDWNIRPVSKTTQIFGSLWARSLSDLCLMVPSARIPLSSFPDEHNLLINPFHPDFITKVKVLETEEIAFNIGTS